MALPPSHSQDLLPNPDILIRDRIERDADRIRLLAHVRQQAVCPACGETSRSAHSRYTRCLQDLPWQGMSVQLWLSVRRFRCRNADCARQIFCERLPQVARAYGRQTERACEVVRAVGYVAGGLPGGRLLVRLGIVTSDDTVLRRVRQHAAWEPFALPVRNLGVDDGAGRKGQDYGPILVNLDLRCVIDLLPVRSADSLSEWLKQHPEVETISRDRCGLYADGAAFGAPHAQQIADRFHLVLNLSSAVERVLEEHSRELILPPAEEPASNAELACHSEIYALSPAAAVPSPTPSQERRQRRLERYEQVIAMFEAGASQRAICRAMGLDRRTVRHWLRRGQFPERKTPHRRAPKVSEFADYIQQRWNEGCHNASGLYREIQAKGYSGKRGMVARFVAGWRKAGKAASPSSSQRIAPRHAAILVTRPAEKMTDEQQQLLDASWGSIRQSWICDTSRSVSAKHWRPATPLSSNSGWRELNTASSVR